MELPYDRPRLIEFHEQQWLPAFIRQPVQNMLSYMWENVAPYGAVSDVLERVMNDIERDDSVMGTSDMRERGTVRIVDCCSGAGGPMPAIEKRLKRVSPPTLYSS